MNKVELRSTRDPGELLNEINNDYKTISSLNPIKDKNLIGKMFDRLIINSCKYVSFSETAPLFNGGGQLPDIYKLLLEKVFINA